MNQLIQTSGSSPEAADGLRALVTMAYQKPFFPMGVAAGTALAPTSVGIALRLLGEAGVLKEDFGQAGDTRGARMCGVETCSFLGEFAMVTHIAMVSCTLSALAELVPVAMVNN